MIADGTSGCGKGGSFFLGDGCCIWSEDPGDGDDRWADSPFVAARAPLAAPNPTRAGSMFMESGSSNGWFPSSASSLDCSPALGAIVDNGIPSRCSAWDRPMMYGLQISASGLSLIYPLTSHRSIRASNSAWSKRSA